MHLDEFEDGLTQLCLGGVVNTGGHVRSTTGVGYV